MKTRLLLGSLLLSFHAFSQTQSEIDLQLTFEAEPPMPWVVGQVGEVRLRVTNLSPILSVRGLILYSCRIRARRVTNFKRLFPSYKTARS